MAKATIKQGKTRVLVKGLKVKLRARVNLATQTESLYLDYSLDGKRKYEFLTQKLLINPKNKEEKEFNKSQMEEADIIRASRENEARNPSSNSDKSLVLFKDYFNYVKDMRIGSGDKKEPMTKASYKCTLDMIELKEGTRFEKLRMIDITEDWLRGVKTYFLETCGKKSTASLYFSKLISVINTAVKERVLKENPSLNVPRIPMNTPEPKFLTVTQLKTLSSKPCESDVLKRAMFTSFYTGLRIGDLLKATWKDICHSEELGNYIVYRQKKTKALKYQALKSEVMALLGERGKPDQLIFEGLKNNTYYSKVLNRWTSDAGIPFHVTPHQFRHSHAISLGLGGANLLEIQNSLGHKDNKTTSKYYARVLGETQRKLIDNLPSFK